jgi:lipoprotein-anchoring transpeptidase ErfK/SrfK
MSVRPGAAVRARSRRGAVALAGLLTVSALAAGCTSASSEDQAGSGPSASSAAGDQPSSAAPSPSTAPVSAVSVASNVRRAGVPVDKTVSLTAEDGSFESVTVKAGRGGKQLAGELSDDKATWTSTARLEPGTRYRVTATAVDGDGVEATKHSSFRTEALSLDQQTYPSFVPLQGQTVGVGMPVIVRFDVPVTDKSAIEQHLSVTNTSDQKGAWHWVSDQEVHWRPVHYWKPGTDVTVTADVNSIPAGNGIYGQLSRTNTFHVGDAVISRVNAQTHQMKTFINGKLAKTTPITTGKPGFTTRSGVKVIIEKFRHRRMNSETVGINRNSPEAYDIDDVEYAMRVTYSGEFLHAAPWSVGSQGYANVSHGCTGMSTANAAWIYNISKPGDVVEYTGTDRPMTLDNGYGDWNASFAAWKSGSALS